MIVARILGWVFIVTAIVVAGVAFALWLSGHNFALVAGQLWYSMSPDSLRTLQSVLLGIYPFLWDGIMLPLLQRPVYQAVAIAFFVPFVLGLILVSIFRRRQRRRRFN